jgi:hypothetical protein
MTPKEKAKQLVERMSMGEEFNGSLELMELYPVPKNKYAKECALIAVELRIDAYGFPPVGGMEWAEKKEQYWQEVKQEIEKL